MVFIVKHASVSLYFGSNAIEKLLRDVDVKGSSVLIVTGRKAAKVSGALDDLLGLLKDIATNIKIYRGIRSSPRAEDIDKLVEVIKELTPDVIVGVGGGSVLDAVKLARHELMNSLEQELIRNRPLLVLVNLTHGTGSEVNRYAVVTKNLTKVGLIVGYSDYSVDDPKYTLSMPKDITLSTSLDALAHALESLTSKLSNRYSQLHSEEAAKIIILRLPSLLKDLNNLKYREDLLYASMLAGIGIDYAGTHLPHAVGNALGGLLTRPHGMLVTVALATLMDKIYERKPSNIWRVLRLIDNTLKPSPEHAAQAKDSFIKYLQEIGAPTKFSDIGVDRSVIKEAVNLVFNSEAYRPYLMRSPVVISKDTLTEKLIENY